MSIGFKQKIFTFFIIITRLMDFSEEKEEEKLKVSNINEVMDYISTINLEDISIRNIEVFGWDFTWKHELTPSVSKYLFEDLEIIENIAPEDNPNRPGGVQEKVYICVHDTGDATYSAKDWNEAVYKAELDGNEYLVSYQYVVGNDGIYHNIPDNETAYHAGDGAQSGSLFQIYETGVYGKVTQPHVAISTDGYYTIEGKKTKIEAPRGDNGQILTVNDINDLGIYTTIKDGQYFIGRTWFSSTYQKISNKGGNLNSIGIESCVNNGTDIYFTWQRLAKLVAKLRYENNLGMDSIVQHHYFSGKDCPMTMRKAGLWKNFLSLVEVEYQMLLYKMQGYTFKFESLNPKYVNDKGRVIYRSNNFSQNIGYKITVTNKNGESQTRTFSTTIPPKRKYIEVKEKIN